MRCADVAQEIAAPSGRLNRDEVLLHVGRCPECAAFAAGAADLDRVWAATRPEEPSSAAFDAVWSAATRAAEVPSVVPFVSGNTRRRLFRLAAVASNAAAVLLLVWTFRPRPVVEPVPAAPSVALTVVPIDQDVRCVIRINDDGIEVDRFDMTAKGPMMALNTDIARSNDNDALNSLESMAE